MSSLYPILSIEQAKSFEESVLGGDRNRTGQAMQNAGRAIGEALLADFRELREWPEKPSILVLAGKGLNTGDAFIACETLHRDLPDLRVKIVMTAEADSLNPLAAGALERLRSTMQELLESVSLEAFMEEEEEPFEVVLDGLYGLGFRPPLREGPAALLRRINGSGRIGLRASVDLPSGIGDSTDPGSFEADFTYIPGVAKAPCFLRENSRYVGRLRFLRIDPFRGAKPGAEPPQMLAPPDFFRHRNQLRKAQSDKRSFGHCLILAGSRRMPGAALMATRAALQAGAGLVTTFCPESVGLSLAGSAPEAMWHPVPTNHDGGLEVETVRIITHMAGKRGALLVGPGLVPDRGTIFTMSRLIRDIALPVVVDASALTREVIAAVLGRPPGAGPVILTPHAGEFDRIRGTSEETELLGQLQLYCQKHRVVTLLKGSPTWIANGSSLVAVPAGGPVLARGGSGDILSGILVTLLGQSPGDPVGAALEAATWHGAAADSLARQQGQNAVRTTELLPHLATTLRA